MDRSGCRKREAENHVHRRRLSRAVHAEQTEDLAAVEAKAETLDGHGSAELLSEIFDFKKDFVHRSGQG